MDTFCLEENSEILFTDVKLSIETGASAVLPFREVKDKWQDGYTYFWLDRFVAFNFWSFRGVRVFV